MSVWSIGMIECSGDLIDAVFVAIAHDKSSADHDRPSQFRTCDVILRKLGFQPPARSRSPMAIVYFIGCRRNVGSDLAHSWVLMVNLGSVLQNSPVCSVIAHFRDL